MLFDVIIRFLAALGLTVLINASGITTLSVVMSICVFLILEISLLVDEKRIYGVLTAIPFVATLIYMIRDDTTACGGVCDYCSIYCGFHNII